MKEGLIVATQFDNNHPGGGTKAFFEKPTSGKDHLLGMSPHEYRRFLPERIEKQIGAFIELFSDYNPRLPELFRRSEIQLDILETFYLEFTIDRNRRAKEVGSREYKDIAEFARELLPMATFMLLCMDGRVKPIHTNGFSADVAKSIRTAGGMLDDDYETVDGEWILKENSNFGRLLLMNSYRNDYLAEVFDSHWTCVARTEEEEAAGNIPEHDKGLYRDIKVKKIMIDAAKKFLTNQPDADQLNVSFIQTQFNPTTGFMYMGLETETALSYVEETARRKAARLGVDPEEEVKYAEFNKGSIQYLINREMIISTGQIVSDIKFREAFSRHLFQIDWRSHYVDSARKFWTNVASLKEELIDDIKTKLLKIYPHLSENTKLTNKELEERAMLILTNSYNTFLHNKDHDEIEYLGMDDKEYEEQGKYPYGIHNEEAVKISEGGQPPYDIPLFVVYPGDLESMEKAAKLVRKNRREKRVADPFGYYKLYPEGFARATIPVVMQVIIRDGDNIKVNDRDFEPLKNADWSDLPADWDSLSREEFDRYIESKGIGSKIVADAVHKLREEMIEVYSYTKASSHLKDLFKVIMPGLYSKDRELLTIIPFVKVARKIVEKDRLNGHTTPAQ